MKPTTTNIKNLIESDIFKTLTSFLVKVEELGFAKEHGEHNLAEAIQELELIVETLSGAIDRSILDSLKEERRNEIIQRLESIQQHIGNIDTGNNEIPQFISQVYSLSDLLRVLNVTFEVTKNPLFRVRVAETTKLRNELVQLMTDLKEADSVNKQVLQIKSEIDIIKSTANESLTDIQESLKSATEKSKALQSISEQVDLIQQNIVQNETRVNTITAKLEEFNNKVDKNEADMRLIIEQAQGVVKDNTELQDQIREQLGKANAVRLFATFEQRKNELTWPIRWMFWSSVTATIIVSLVGYWLFLDFKSNPVEYWNILLIKLPIVTPLIFLAVIFYRRYSREKRLQEEYAFKSAVSLSLEAYRELLEKETIKEGEKSELVKFLTTSVDKIFTSPSEALHKYPETNEDVVSLSGLDKLLETILKHLK